MEDLKEILKKCFGKEKDNRYHAIAMLIIYGIFMLILIVTIRLGSNNTTETDKKDEFLSSTPLVTSNPTNTPSSDNDTFNSNENINYSYSYTVSYNGSNEVFLGKRVGNKEKITYIKDNVINNYAILNDNYLILENGTYHITNNFSSLFKYCDISEILSLVDDEIPTENGGIISYQVSNTKLAISFKDKITVNNELNNNIIITTTNNQLKAVDLDLTNYISSKEGITNTLTIHMEFVDIGTTDDFDVSIN